MVSPVDLLYFIRYATQGVPYVIFVSSVFSVRHTGRTLRGVLSAIYHFSIHIADFVYLTLGNKLSLGENDCFVADTLYRLCAM